MILYDKACHSKICTLGLLLCRCTNLKLYGRNSDRRVTLTKACTLLTQTLLFQGMTIQKNEAEARIIQKELTWKGISENLIRVIIFNFRRCTMIKMPPRYLS